MKVYNHRVELIMNAPLLQAKGRSASGLKKQLSDAGIPVEAIRKKAAPLPAAKKANAKNFSGTTREKLYVKTGIRDTEMTPWDVAHLATKAGTAIGFVEPDLLNEFVVDRNFDAAYKHKGAKGKAKPEDNGFDPDWQPHQNSIWHLGDHYSQLKSAREAVANATYTVRIAHLDTGYDPAHTVIPDAARKNRLQRNFVDGEAPTDAHDPRTNGALRMPGHGTGTLGLLAGNKMKITTDAGLFHDYIGGAPFAEIICCRIAPSVVLFKTSAFAEAVNYLAALTRSGIPIHVASMSMGGAPSRAWAEAVNAAYEAGITLVTAAGNNFNGLPTRHVVYPARFRRVIAACGVTNDLLPYHSSKRGEMQGCYGPERHMEKALAAFTPNTPWASGSGSVIKFSGAGTSSATPQIAAAAAIYYRKYHRELNSLEPWQRVEAIRYALYKSASKTAKPIGSFKKSFGNGVLKAFDALSVPVNTDVSKTPPDTVPLFPILATIFKAAPTAQPGNKLTMFNTELTQLVYYYPELAAILDDENKSFEKISKAQWKKFKDAVIQHPGTSLTLKKHLMAVKA